MTVSPLTALLRNPTLPSGNPGASSSATFADVIGSAIATVENSSAAAKTATADLLIGGKGDVHNVALAAQRAELSMELFQQVRNKFVSAYQEIMKMPM